MEPEIGQPDLLQERSHGTMWWNLFGDSTQIYEISSKIEEFNKVTKVLLNTIIIGSWHELDQYYDFKCDFAAGSARYKKTQEDKVFEFLAGLHKDLDYMQTYA